MLFIINKSATQSHALSDCVKKAYAGDVILLIEHAVYSVVEIKPPAVFQALRENVSVCALQPDLLVRGLDKERCYDFLEYVDYSGFVALVENNKPIRSCF
ncbi:MAG: sulfurtransferase complex subunit TusB [Cycloclasticus sp.]|nr:MAG: sulfurtransferase complex subunit TusB [Cycloclasticus sp.]